MSLPDTLPRDYERIYYIDLLTDHYLEFSGGVNGEFEIRPDGKDFFRALPDKLVQDVPEEDKAALETALSKDNLKKWIGQDETLILSFRRVVNGSEKRFAVRTIRTRNSGGHYIVIGVRAMDVKVAMEENV